MPLLAGDIRFARSSNMADVPEGGGPPSAKLLTSGRSNEIFPDISEETRTVGRVEIYQIFSVLRNADRTPLLGSNTILAQPPADPNISMTLLSLRDPFATRADIVQRIESGMSPGTEFSGFLLENHFETMRSMTIFQRPGSSPPTIGRTYLLVFDEGKSSERRQRVRIKATDTVQRMFTEIAANGEMVDFLGQVTTCELFDGLAHDFPGSPPTRTFARKTDKTLTRETVYSDSGMFYGASPLVQPTLINDVWLRVASIYTQIVPNSRTEVASVDQYPGARQTLTLASTPREVKVGITPHTQRIRIAEENAGRLFVALLKPAPAAGTVFIDFWSLGNRYTLTDDGEGRITGQGSGSINYLTGALQLTLKHIPDIGSSITITHGAKSAYTNRAGQAGFRAPEFAWQLPHQGLKPGSVVVTWLSGGVLKTAADNGTGGFTSASGAGEIDYATGKIYLRPTAMIDAGGEFVTDYEYQTVVTENFAAPAVDAGGFGSLTLAETPIAKSVTVRWITVRSVSSSSGVSEIVSSSKNAIEVPAVVVTPPAQPTGNYVAISPGYVMPGSQIRCDVRVVSPHSPGTYTWELYSPDTPDLTVIFAGGATTGAFTVNEPPQQLGSGGAMGATATGVGSFSLPISSSCPDLRFALRIKNQALTLVTASNHVEVDAVGDKPPPAWPEQPPPPVIVVRDPEADGSVAKPIMEIGGLHWQDRSRIYVRVVRTQLAPGSRYADKDGMGYDLPEVFNTAVIWDASDLAAGFRTITSVAGVPTVYHLWR